MKRRPAFARAFKGRWRIVEMNQWDNDYLDLVEEAHITFTDKSDGEFVFGAVKGWLDVCYGSRDGSACAEFFLGRSQRRRSRLRARLGGHGNSRPTGRPHLHPQ